MTQSSREAKRTTDAEPVDGSSTDDGGGAGGRHAGREVALQVLYALDLGQTGPRDAQASRAARATREDPEVAAPPPPSPRIRTLSRSGRSADTVLRKGTKRTRASKPSLAIESIAEDLEPTEAFELDPVAASELVFDRITEHFSVPGSAIAFARKLVAGVAGRTQELDALVGQHARNWRVSRMAAVDRNVLRLAVYELRDTDTPVAVVIDEAVDLARRFGSDSSPAFVNGVLDSVAREVRAA